MSKIVPITVAFGDKTESAFVRRLRYRQQMRLFGVLRQGAKTDEDVKPENIADY